MSPTIWTPFTNWIFLHSNNNQNLALAYLVLFWSVKDDMHDTRIFHQHQSIQGFWASKSHMIHVWILIENQKNLCIIFHSTILHKVGFLRNWTIPLMASSKFLNFSCACAHLMNTLTYFGSNLSVLMISFTTFA